MPHGGYPPASWKADSRFFFHELHDHLFQDGPDVVPPFAGNLVGFVHQAPGLLFQFRPPRQWNVVFFMLPGQQPLGPAFFLLPNKSHRRSLLGGFFRK